MIYRIFFFISFIFTCNCLCSQNEINKITELLDKNNLKKSESLIKSYFINDTNSINYLFLTGRLERKKGNYIIAEYYLKKCLNLDSLYAMAHAGLGTIYCINKQYNKALISMNKAIALDSSNMDFYNDRSAIYYDTNEFEKAYNDLLKAYTKYPNDEYLIHNMGTALNALNRYKEAIVYFNKVNIINPKEARNHFDRGIAYYQIDEPKKAIKDLKMAIKYNHKTILNERIELYKIYRQLALAYSEINEPKKSERYQIKALNNGWTDTK